MIYKAKDFNDTCKYEISWYDAGQIGRVYCDNELEAMEFADALFESNQCSIDMRELNNGRWSLSYCITTYGEWCAEYTKETLEHEYNWFHAPLQFIEV